MEELRKAVLVKLHNCAAVPIVLFDLHVVGSNVAFSVFSVFIDSSASTSSFVPFIQGGEIGADNPLLKTTRDDPHTYKYGSGVWERRGLSSL